MEGPHFAIEQFRPLAVEALSFLEDNGFRRVPSLEQTTSTCVTVIYLGEHVGLTFSLDVRDQCVDANVVKVRGGQMAHTWQGGYSSNLFGHLVKHAGYRGDSARAKNGPSVRAQIDRWAQLLKEAGQSLLSDRPESLPERGGVG